MWHNYVAINDEIHELLCSTWRLQYYSHWLRHEGALVQCTRCTRPRTNLFNAWAQMWSQVLEQLILNLEKAGEGINGWTRYCDWKRVIQLRLLMSVGLMRLNLANYFSAIVTSSATSFEISSEFVMKTIIRGFLPIKKWTLYTNCMPNLFRLRHCVAMSDIFALSFYCCLPHQDCSNHSSVNCVLLWIALICFLLSNCSMMFMTVLNSVRD